MAELSWIAAIAELPRLSCHGSAALAQLREQLARLKVNYTDAPWVGAEGWSVKARMPLPVVFPMTQ